MIPGGGGATFGCGPPAVGSGLPWNYTSNLIADAWELGGPCRRYLDPGEDNEPSFLAPGFTSPTKGDGYTAFEEYRGFIYWDRAIVNPDGSLGSVTFNRTDPCSVKDVFIYDYQTFNQPASVDDVFQNITNLLQPLMAVAGVQFHEVFPRLVTMVPPVAPARIPTIGQFNRGSYGNPISQVSSNITYPIVYYLDDPAPSVLPPNVMARSQTFSIDNTVIIFNHARILDASILGAHGAAGSLLPYGLLFAQTIAHEAGHKMSLRHSHRQAAYIPPPISLTTLTPGQYTIDAVGIVYSPGFYYLFGATPAFGEEISKEPMNVNEIGSPACYGAAAPMPTDFWRPAAPMIYTDPTNPQQLVLTATPFPGCTQTDAFGFAQTLGIKNQEAVSPRVYNIMNWTPNLSAASYSNWAFSPKGLAQACPKRMCP